MVIDAARTWHGKWESDTATLCKSIGKDTFQTLSGTAWQGKGMGAAWARQAMCGLVLSRQRVEIGRPGEATIRRRPSGQDRLHPAHFG